MSYSHALGTPESVSPKTRILLAIFVEQNTENMDKMDTRKDETDNHEHTSDYSGREVRDQSVNGVHNTILEL